MDEEEATKEETKKPPTDSISHNICWHFGNSSRWPRTLLFDLKGISVKIVRESQLEYRNFGRIIS